jgi:hypothetical protein
MPTALALLLLLGAVLLGLLGLSLLVFSLWPLAEQGQAGGALAAGLTFAGLGVLCLIASGVLVRLSVRALRRR